MFLSSARNKLTLLKQNSVTDVSMGFQPPWWCPSEGAATWRLHTNLLKFVWKISTHILLKRNQFKTWRESVLIFILIYFEWRELKTSNFSSLLKVALCRRWPLLLPSQPPPPLPPFHHANPTQTGKLSMLNIYIQHRGKHNLRSWRDSARVLLCWQRSSEREWRSRERSCEESS